MSSNHANACSIIIRCFNEEEHIGRLLAGVLEQSIPAEIVVVDSGSTDATRAIVSAFPVRLLSIDPAEFSFGRALNIGCEVARGKYLVIASAHVYPIYRDWLENLLAPFEDDKVALVYGKQRGNQRSHFSERQIFAKWFPDQSDQDQPHPFCNNANAAIRAETYKTIRYDEQLTGLEDIDWARRAMSAGFKIAYAAGAEVIHVHNESPSRIFNRYRREAMAMKSMYPGETFSFLQFLSYFGRNAANDLAQAFRERVFLRKSRQILMFRFLQFLATYRGYARGSGVNEQLRSTFYYPSSPSIPTPQETKATEDRLIDYGKIHRH